VRVLIVSDVHGNIDALDRLDEWRASRRPFDAIWLLGDLVDYGGDPGAVIAWARANAAVVVRGNHDHAMATGESCRSSAIFWELSTVSRDYFRPRLPPDALAYLNRLPLTAQVEVAPESIAVLTHACPRDPLFGYVAREDAVAWGENAAIAGSPAFLFVGHTHEQFVKELGATTLVNPGSLGLPTDGDTRAAFAVMDDGRVELHRLEYDLARARERIRALAIAPAVRHRLDLLLRDARVPPL